MDNENEVIVDPNNENGEETIETPEEKVEKPKRTPQEELAYFEGRAKRLRKDLGLETEPKPEPKKEESPLKPSELGFAEKAFLQGNDIRGEKEFEIVREYLKTTSLDEIVDENTVVGEIIRGKIKRLRETEATSKAVPKGTKGSTSSPKDSVDYWLKKPFNEVPQEMKVAVNNKRMELEKARQALPPQ